MAFVTCRDFQALKEAVENQKLDIVLAARSGLTGKGTKESPLSLETSMKLIDAFSEEIGYGFEEALPKER